MFVELICLFITEPDVRCTCLAAGACDAPSGPTPWSIEKIKKKIKIKIEIEIKIEIKINKKINK